MEDVSIFYGHSIYFKDIWYSLWYFGTFFPMLVNCTKKNPATLSGMSLKQCDQKCFWKSDQNVSSLIDLA
jgi:hypothetical protein